MREQVPICTCPYRGPALKKHEELKPLILTHSPLPTHSLTHSLSHSLAHSLTHSLARSLRQLLLAACSRKLRDGRTQYVARLKLQLKREHVHPLSYACIMPCMCLCRLKVRQLIPCEVIPPTSVFLFSQVPTTSLSRSRENLKPHPHPRLAQWPRCQRQ